MKLDIKKNGSDCTLPADQLITLLQENKELKSDIETAVSNVGQILLIIGIINADGTKNEKFRLRNLTGLLMGGDISSKFSFLADPKVTAVLEKYSYSFSKKSTDTRSQDIDNLIAALKQ